MGKAKKRRKRKPTILLGQRIDEARERRGWSRPHLAALLGVDPSAVRSWSTGATAPRDLQAVADVLGVTPADLWRAA